MTFPTISISGSRITPRDHVEPGTGSAVAMAYLLGAISALAITLVTYGIALIAFLVSPLINWYLRRKALARIHGSGIKVGPSQFKEIHDCVQDFSKRLGVEQAPDVYIIDTATANAAAVRLGKRNVILLTDEVVHGAIHAGTPHALAFVIGHELAHVALKHNTGFRLFVAGVYKRLSRLDEYTADRVANALVGDKQISLSGLAILASGYQLMKYLDLDALRKQAKEVANDKYSLKAEKTLTHPLLLNRINRFA